ncbi:DUF4376 domain-containing protein [Sphingobium phenoxybenzoativorans]|uniref:DUF4376 domain-containing protein n=1 Tax=Sphingobium phenoxybenzoativorans TaxID=1592790 RepID=A0A975K5V4_9SPHN|nr:DUF4376 domain-containing protein [Sphingobium phenoxybenzoativorans]QUT04057.1 DUF4376 domain-containing protein [Sphingobium phenoxybenzoativorans]
MMQAFIIDADGVARQRIKATDASQFDAIPIPDGHQRLFYDGEGDIEDVETYLDGDDIAIRVRTPDLAAAFLVAQIGKRSAIMKRRNLAEWGGATTPLGVMDSDPDSQRKVNGAASMAMIADAAGQPFSIDWTMQDNSIATHDAAAMMAAGTAMGEHVSACHANALVLKAQVDAATDIPMLDAIDIEVGWP